MLSGYQCPALFLLHRRWFIFCIKQCFKAVYLSSHATKRISLSPRSQCRSGCPGCRQRARRQVPHKHAGHGPGGRAHSLTGQAACRVWHWRHALAVIGPGGTCHVPPGQTCRHQEVVSFDKYFQSWSFLTFRWCRWSNVSKIRHCGVFIGTSKLGQHLSSSREGPLSCRAKTEAIPQNLYL
jgi:hypothetical protein